MAFDIFELRAKLGLDKREYEEGLEDAESQASGFGGKLMGALGTGAKVLGEVSLAATGAAITGVTALTTASVNAYGNFEQLAGGVEKLFGDASESVMAYADVAYESAGMSANEYMETVTSFSASLISGLGGDTEQAAEIADMAIRDMADNANTFGTSMESIQNAYAGFARGNYTMLDNLKLGYAGSAEGMLQLVNDSGILEEAVDSLDNVSFDQMIQAIHAVQTDFNITGTTANEAAGTIQGSLSTLQGAWTNLITGLGNGSADLGKLIDNVVNSAMNVVKNIRPIATQAVQGIATMVKEIAPILKDEIPSLVEEILPDLLSAVTTLVNTVMEVLPSLVQTLLPVAIEAALTIVDALGKFLQSDSAVTIIMTLVEGLLEALPKLIDAAIKIVTQLAINLTEPNNLSKLINAALQLMVALAEGVITAMPILIDTIPTIIRNVLATLVMDFPEIVTALLTLLFDMGVVVLEAMMDIMGINFDAISKNIGEINDMLGDAFEAIGMAFVKLGADIVIIVTGFWDDVVGFFDGGLGDIAGGVTDGLGDILSTFTNIFDDVKDVVTDGIDWILDKFDFDWEFPHINLPHFSVSGGKAPWGFGGHGHLPEVSVEWYAKAYREPIMLSSPTIFGMDGDKLLGGGEGHGSEMIYGKDALMKDIAAAVASVDKSQQIVIPVYIGNEMIDEIVVNSNQRNDYISGGRG